MAEEPRKQTVPAAGSGLRLAARSSSAELHPGWAWGLTALVILGGGVTLYAARSAVGTSLDRWLPKLERATPEVTAEVPVAVPAPDPGVEPTTGPQWTYVDVEAAIRPLPERTGTLIAEGRNEMSEFKGLDSKDETRALLIRNRWRSWGRIWHNRVNHVRRSLPPAEACDIHAALEPTCRAVRESLALVEQVPLASSTDKARELLDGAAAILAQLRESQAETEPDAAASSATEPGAP